MKERQKMKKQSIDEGEKVLEEKASIKSKGHRKKRSNLKYNAS